jgi:hypothetical protein
MATLLESMAYTKALLLSLRSLAWNEAARAGNLKAETHPTV